MTIHWKFLECSDVTVSYYISMSNNLINDAFVIIYIYIYLTEKVLLSNTSRILSGYRFVLDLCGRILSLMPVW